VIHDFVRDSLRNALIQARPAAAFLKALDSSPAASPSIMPAGISALPGAPQSLTAALPGPDPDTSIARDTDVFRLTPRIETPLPGTLPFGTQGREHTWEQTAAALIGSVGLPGNNHCSPASDNPFDNGQSTANETARVEAEQAAANLNHLGSLKPLGQLRESFILATGEDGLWIIDQHVAHERVLFEKILRDREVEHVQRQRLLMPLLMELKPWQIVVFAQIADELERNGFEVEPFGPQTLAIKAAPVGLQAASLERMLAEVIEQSSDVPNELTHNEDLTSLKTRIAASIACHSAIKVNTPLDPVRMEWLLLELAKTEHPTSCPHGRPIALLYSWKDILRAFHRI
jgi:DNA mismatch repair protein MutL